MDAASIVASRKCTAVAVFMLTIFLHKNIKALVNSKTWHGHVFDVNVSKGTDIASVDAETNQLTPLIIPVHSFGMSIFFWNLILRLSLVCHLLDGCQWKFYK